MVLKMIFSVLWPAAVSLAGNLYPACSAAEPPYPLERLENRVNSSEITFSYTYHATGGRVSMTGGGSVVLQGDAFILNVDGMEICCDGITKWTLDRDAGELVIEPYDSSSADLGSNPAVLLRRLASFFEVSSSSASEYSGVKAIKVELEPKSHSRFRSIVLYFRAEPSDGDILAGASMETSDGTVTDFVISDFMYGPKGDISRFGFDTSALDKSWIVTDLR